MRRTLASLAVAVMLAAGACGSSVATGTAPTGTTPEPTTAAPISTALPAADPTASATPVPDDAVWLCKPGLPGDPCAGNLDATVVDAGGGSTVQPASPAVDPPIDCFYVYPTVSRQSGTNANLTIDPEERAVASAQAALFSQVCRVYAPMYPQLTVAAISKPGGITLQGALTAYQGVAAAFEDYMANYNHGRGIVFIGHSQGASMLIGLVRSYVDSNASVRKQLVSALILGGNVTVPIGRTVGGDFTNIPACSSAGQTGCVVAYSSFDRTPPADAFFGRPGSGLNPFAGSSAGLQVLCVNPAAPAGGAGTLRPYFPTSSVDQYLGSGAPWARASTTFVAYPDEFSARCESSGGATWLQIDRTGTSADRRPTLSVGSAPEWGLHVVDVNIALGNLVELVRSQAAAYGA